MVWDVTAIYLEVKNTKFLCCCVFQLPYTMALSRVIFSLYGKCGPSLTNFDFSRYWLDTLIAFKQYVAPNFNRFSISIAIFISIKLPVVRLVKRWLQSSRKSSKVISGFYNDSVQKISATQFSNLWSVCLLLHLACPVGKYNDQQGLNCTSKEVNIYLLTLSVLIT